MFGRIMIIVAISGMFFTSTAFAHGHHGHNGYWRGGYGYAPYYGGYAPAGGYYPVPQPYYAPPPIPYGGYPYYAAPVISIPIFGGGWGYGGYAHHGHH